MDRSGLQSKHDALRNCLRGMSSVIVALSGGVDSSLVAYVAHQELGDRALAVTSGSASLKREDLELCRCITAEWGMSHFVVDTPELHNPDYAANPVNRCYFCKSTLYQALADVAREKGFATVLNGANVDDMGDHRPGMLAAREFAVRSPLLECGFRKADIRALSAELGLRNADKPQAACLSSRVPYGTPISQDLLDRIERAERALGDLGFTQCRVRHHGEVARLEILPGEFERAIALREEVSRALKACGYVFVCLDLEGFRSGSLNHGRLAGVSIVTV
ncbi:ATP-dependent sacrificial sulfur transferase LarE [Paraburkholderia sediminicola]|uniref:ATP-dependent sacrificial sulfur transferase LarE n=1 Tax=Paraburkholderia sediminicola TaxID=458836 RepID=UPI0038B6CDDA